MCGGTSQVELERALTDATFRIEQLQGEIDSHQLQLLDRSALRSASDMSHDGDRIARLEGRLDAATADNTVLQQTMTALRAAYVRLVPANCDTAECY